MTPPIPSALFSPCTVGGRQMKNRLVALPVYTGYAFPGGRVSRLALEHYDRLARSGVALVVVANAAVSENGILSDHNLRADRDELVPDLARLAETIKARGALACLQLNHGGRFARTARPLLPSAMDSSNLAFNVVSLKNFMNFFPFEVRTGLTRRFLSMAGTWARPMTTEERLEVIADFGRAARRACAAGFDMVELHGAGGYLICQMLSAFSNKNGREDGQLFLLDLFREVRRSLPDGFPVGYRLITREWVPDGIDLPEALALAAMLEREGAAYLSASAGSYNSMFSPLARKQMDSPGYLRADVGALTRTVAVPTIISGRISTPELAERLIVDGDARLIGLGRVLRADPKWVSKAADPTARIKTCLNCSWCLKRVVLDQGFNCKRWPQQLQEKTDLECKLLSRNYRGLMVAADDHDLARLGAVLPHLLPRRKTLKIAIAPTLLMLTTDPQKAAADQTMPAGAIGAAAKRAFEKAARNILDRLGFADSRMLFIERTAQGAFDQEVHAQAQQGNNGLIIVPRRPGEGWRDKVALLERKKIVILLGTGVKFQKVLVPIDLSVSSQLVLMFLRQIFAEREDLDFSFVHVRSEAVRMVEQKWLKTKQLVGLPADTPLRILPAGADAGGQLADLFKAEGFDAIVMGRRGISRIKYLLLGSVSAAILRRLPGETVILVD